MKASMILTTLITTALFTLGGCGDGDSTDVTINNPDIQREEGPVETQDPVRVNVKVNNRVKVQNTVFVIDNDDLVLDCDVQDAEPVNHVQVIYVAPNCSAIQNADVDNNTIVDRSEVEAITGVPVAVLESQEGADYTVNQRVPINQLPALAENFVFVVYGDQEAGINIPIICMPFQVQIINTSPTTGGTDGGGTTGGTTTGGTTGGTTTGGTTDGTTTGGTTGFSEF